MIAIIIIIILIAIIISISVTVIIIVITSSLSYLHVYIIYIYISIATNEKTSVASMTSTAPLGRWASGSLEGHSMGRRRLCRKKLTVAHPEADRLGVDHVFIQQD